MQLYASKPYDMIKLLLRISIGDNERPKIINMNENIATVELDEGSIVSVFFDELNNEYTQTIFTEENSIYEMEDYQKYLFETSRILLVSTVLKVLEIQDFFHTYNYKYHQFMNDYESSLSKLTFELSSVWKKFIQRVELQKDSESEISVRLIRVFELLSEYKDKFMYYDKIDMLNFEILSIVFTTLIPLLHSLVLNVTFNSNIHLEEIYNVKYNERICNKFIKSIVETDNMDGQSKIKFFSLLLLFYQLNRYYRVYSGITFNDPTVIILANIGLALSKLLQSDNDFKYIDNEFMNGIFGSGKSIFGFLGRYDSLIDFVNYKENFSIKSDISVPLIHGSSFLDFLQEPTIPQNDKSSLADFYTPIIFKYIQSNLFITKFKEKDNLNINRSFNYLSHILQFIEEEVITTIDPFTFYQITLIASTYRYIKSKDEIYKSLDTEKKSFITFGIWLADVILYQLYTHWFYSGKFYNQVQRPKYCENKIQTTLNILKKEVDVVAISYLEFIKFLSSNKEDFIESVNSSLFLFKRNYDRIETLMNGTNMFNKVNIKTFISNIRTQSSSILYIPLISKFDNSFELIRILKNISTFVNLSSTDIPKKIKMIKIEETVLHNDFLDKLLILSSDIDSSNCNEYEYFFLTTLPLIDFFEKKSEENQTGISFQFITPERQNKLINYEFMVHEYVTKPISSLYLNLNKTIKS